MTNATIIDGKRIATQVIEKVTKATATLIADTGIRPGIAVVIVGEDPASQVYVRSKGKRAEECGFLSQTYKQPEDCEEGALLDLIATLNNDDNIHAILVQLPLPDHIDEEKIIQKISAHKDVDGFNFINVGKLGTGKISDAFVPCTPAGCMILLEQVMGTGDLSGKNAVVIGRSNIVGKPIANLLLAANATVTIAHSRTSDLPELAASADILVAAVGRPQMVKQEWIKPGAIVIDVGINRIQAPQNSDRKTRLVGDVAFDECAQIASAITPVPGGVGPMTIAMLMASTLDAACRKAGVETPQI